MPFRPSHQHKSSNSSQTDKPSKQHGALSGIYHAAQTLGSIGAPTGNLRQATSGTTSAGTDDLYFSADLASSKGGEQSAPPYNSVLPGAEHSSTSASRSVDISNSSSLDDPSRMQPYGRQPEELHIPSNNGIGDLHHGQPQYQNPPAYGGNGAPSINLHQSTSQRSDFSNHQPANNVPGALQPGGMNRPGPLSANTAPSSIPTLPQITTQQPTTPSRSATLNHNHSYSRSSPAGFDQQKYKPFNNAPENSKYTPSNASNYNPQTPQASSYSPLGLADIRPRADTGLSDGPQSPGIFPHNGELQIPTNSSYIAPWAIYALDWCKWPSQPGSLSAGKIAVGSYLEDSHNYIQILEAQRAPPDGDPHGDPELDFTKSAEATHSYPVTRILWEPPSSQKQSTDLLATSGDHLRLWSLPSEAQSQYTNNLNNRKDRQPQKLSPLALLSNSKSPEHTAPITSLDWNVVSPSLIITSSIDTTCTIWDIPTLTAKTQLIAHDKEVYDVRFCANSVDVFVSCGADGSVRMFDLRSLEHSTIIYEPSDKGDKPINSPGNISPTTAQQTMSFPPPLLRIAASPHDAHLLATFSQDSSIIRVLDVRQPGQALLELRGHAAPVNTIEWSPSRRGTLASGADDSLVLIWDLLSQTGQNMTPASSTERGPSAAWQCEYEVGNLSWAPENDTLGVCGGRVFWGVSM